MRYVLFVTAVAVVLLGNISFAHGQKAAERFIPIGQSPGVSGKFAHVGEIESVDAAKRRLTVRGEADRRYTATVTGRTRIWLDRSKLKLAAQTGGFADLKPGRRVEVKYEDPARPGAADWIKVEAGAPDAAPGPARP